MDDGTLANFAATLKAERDAALQERDKWRDKAHAYRRKLREAGRGAENNARVAQLAVARSVNKWKELQALRKRVAELEARQPPE